MDLNLLTIAQRATLSSTIDFAFTNALAQVSQIEALTTKIEASEEFTTLDKDRNRNFSIIGLTSIAEHLLNDVLTRILIAYPRKLGNKQFVLDELLEEGSVLELFYKKAKLRVLDLAYGRFEKFIRLFTEIAELTSNLDEQLVTNVNEIKCTRDCVIHSDSRANSLYFEKTVQAARVRGIGAKLDTSLTYFSTSAATITDFITGIKARLPTKYTASTKSHVFKQMWEATCLNDRVKFNQAWKIVDGYMVRPMDIQDDFGFSSSELAIYDLFRHIFQRREYPVDFAFLFSKWKSQSNEHQIAMSWLDSQFYF